MNGQRRPEADCCTAGARARLDNGERHGQVARGGTLPPASTKNSAKIASLSSRRTARPLPLSVFTPRPEPSQTHGRMSEPQAGARCWLPNVGRPATATLEVPIAAAQQAIISPAAGRPRRWLGLANGLRLTARRPGVFRHLLSLLRFARRKRNAHNLANHNWSQRRNSTTNCGDPNRIRAWPKAT